MVQAMAIGNSCRLRAGRERLAARTCAAVSGSFDSGHRPVVGGVLEPGLELRGGTV